MLVAQLTCAYEAVYSDMIGYARLERIEIIVGVLPSVSQKRWVAFVESLKLDSKVEFNAGDIGVTGGIQILEAANLNPTTQDMIKRFGGIQILEAANLNPTTQDIGVTGGIQILEAANLNPTT